MYVCNRQPYSANKRKVYFYCKRCPAKMAFSIEGRNICLKAAVVEHTHSIQDWLPKPKRGRKPRKRTDKIQGPQLYDYKDA